MYSVLMVMALNVGAAATPAWDHGCGGCWSSGSCYATSCSGCWGGCSSSCHGGHKLFGGLFNKHGRCSGCYSSCSGCSWGGCSSSHVVSYGCTGCSGCYSSCNGCHGGHKLFGGLFNKHNRCHGCSGCYSSCSGYAMCSGCSGQVMGCTGCTGAPMMAAPAGAAPAPAPAPAPKKEGGSGKSASLSQAEVLVSLPVEAKLFIDGQATVSTSNTRKFVSPELEQGKEYFYTLRAEVVRDGQTVSLTKEVTVRAGETVQASFDFPAQVAAK